MGSSAKKRWYSESLLQSNRHLVWHHAEDERRIAMGRVIAGRGAESKPGNHIALPMGLQLHPRDRDIYRKGLQRIHGRTILSVFQHERSYRRAGERHLARRKAVMAVALEPLVGVVDLARPRPGEDLFQERGAHRLDGDGIQRLPIGPAEPRLTAFPQGAADHDGEGPVLDEGLVAALPDSAVVVGEPVIDAERSTAG